MDYDYEARNFVLMINCNNQEVEQAKSTSVAPDKFEFALSKNTLNWLIPYAYKVRFNSIVDRVMHDYPHYINYKEEYDLGLVRGFFRLTQDPYVLDQLPKKDGYSKPCIEVVSGEHGGNQLLRFTSGVFVEFQDKTNYTENDLAIAPVDLIVDLNVTLKDNENGT